MRKILGIIGIIVISIIMQTPAIQAQNNNGLLYWLGLDNLSNNDFFSILDIEMHTSFAEDSTKTIEFISGSYIFSSLEKDSIYGLRVVVLFWFKDSPYQEIVVYQYPYKQGYLSDYFEIKENFELYFDYCKNSLGNKEIIKDSWINLWVFPKSTLCAQVLTTLDIEYMISLPRFVNFLRIKELND